MADICGECRFYNGTGGLGRCRRYAPSPIPGVMLEYIAAIGGHLMPNETLFTEHDHVVDLTADWPTVDADDDWCGEFAAREQGTA